MPDILRMRCPGKRHPAILPIPEGALAGPGGAIVLRSGREVGGRWWPYPVLCASEGSCSDLPVYGDPDADVRFTMKACTVRGRPAARECGPAGGFGLLEPVRTGTAAGSWSVVRGGHQSE